MCTSREREDMPTCIQLIIYIYVYIHMYISYMYICVFTFVYIYIYIIHTYICTYIYIVCVAGLFPIFCSLEVHGCTDQEAELAQLSKTFEYHLNTYA